MYSQGTATYVSLPSFLASLPPSAVGVSGRRKISSPTAVDTVLEQHNYTTVEWFDDILSQFGGGAIHTDAPMSRLLPDNRSVFYWCHYRGLAHYPFVPD